jgi:hypothetical protein
MDSRNPSIRYEAEIKSQMPYYYTTQLPQGLKFSRSKGENLTAEKAVEKL